jgi:DoxX-like family
MTPKTKRVISQILTGIPVFVLLLGGIMKIVGKEPETVMQFLTKSGFGNYLIPLGLTEVTIAALVTIPKTTKIGFLLASCYFSGALCLEISGGQPTASVLFLVLLWIGLFLKNKEMFVESVRA